MERDSICGAQHSPRLPSVARFSESRPQCYWSEFLWVKLDDTFIGSALKALKLILRLFYIRPSCEAFLVKFSRHVYLKVK